MTSKKGKKETLNFLYLSENTNEKGENKLLYEQCSQIRITRFIFLKKRIIRLTYSKFHKCKSSYIRIVGEKLLFLFSAKLSICLLITFNMQIRMCILLQIKIDEMLFSLLNSVNQLINDNIYYVDIISIFLAIKILSVLLCFDQSILDILCCIISGSNVLAGVCFIIQFVNLCIQLIVINIQLSYPN